MVVNLAWVFSTVYATMCQRTFLCIAVLVTMSVLWNCAALRISFRGWWIGDLVALFFDILFYFISWKETLFLFLSKNIGRKTFVITLCISYAGARASKRLQQWRTRHPLFSFLGADDEQTAIATSLKVRILFLFPVCCAHGVRNYGFRLPV